MIDNIIRHRRQGRKPVAGGLFVTQCVGIGWTWHRVVQPAPEATYWKDLQLVYQFRHVYREDAAFEEVEAVRVSTALAELLCGPMLVANSLWTSGYALEVKWGREVPQERMARHVFRYSLGCTKYYDEHNTLIESVGVGEWYGEKEAVLPGGMEYYIRMHADSLRSIT